MVGLIVWGGIRRVTVVVGMVGVVAEMVAAAAVVVAVVEGIEFLESAGLELALKMGGSFIACMP